MADDGDDANLEELREALAQALALLQEAANNLMGDLADGDNNAAANDGNLADGDNNVPANNGDGDNNLAANDGNLADGDNIGADSDGDGNDGGENSNGDGNDGGENSDGDGNEDGENSDGDGNEDGENSDGDGNEDGENSDGDGNEDEENSGDEVNESNDDGGDEDSSDEELPDLAFLDDGGGELMRDEPVHEVDQLAQDPDIEMEDISNYDMIDHWYTIEDEAIETFLESLCPYISLKDMLKFRLASSRFNTVIIKNAERLYKNCKGTYNSSFYKVGYQWNSQMSIQPHLIAFQSFIFQRRHDFFKRHWQLTASNLTTLELNNCSFECEGIKFLVDFAPNLNKLSISHCKLRDVDNFHKKPRKDPITKVAVPKDYVGIKILHLEGIKVIENCFMKYFINKIKPNTLTELSLTKCFIDEFQPIKGTIKAVEYFRCFAPLFLKLIVNNAQSLKKMAFNGNAFQMLLLQQLTGDSAVMKLLEPTHLSLSLLKPVTEELNWNHLLQFLRDRCSKLENLNLQIVDYGNIQNVRNVFETMTLINCPLKSFNFEFNGNSKDGEIDLEGLLRQSRELKHLVISDSKALDPNVKYILGGQRSWRYRLHSCFGFTPAHGEQLIRDSLTNIPSTVLTQLPPKLDTLCVKRLIPDTNIWFECFQNPACLEAFKNLTKLEICGPYIHSMHLVVPQIFTLANLESLALQNCDIQDTHITGLGLEVIMDLRRCLTICLASMRPGSSKEDLDKAILEAPKYADPANNQALMAPRPKLSDLSKLKYLDLSNNLQVSDVGIYYSAKMPLVKNLTLQNCSKVTDNGLWMIGMNFPSLRVLNVKNCSKMSKFGLNELIKKCNTVKKIQTTKVVIGTKFVGIKFQLHPLFDEIVCTSTDAHTEGFILDKMLET